MFQAVSDGLHWVLGEDLQHLTVWQVGVRVLVVYLVALMLVRLRDSRHLLGKHAAFDVVVGIIVGSVLSRGINGTAPFLITLAGGVILIALHWIFADLSFHNHHFGRLIKGNEATLIRDGELQWDQMAHWRISERDLMEFLRINGKLDDPKQVRLACLERNGEISVIQRQPTDRTPQVITIAVEQGVQTVRIELVS